MNCLIYWARYVCNEEVKNEESLTHLMDYPSLGLNTLCKGCSSHMTLVELLYPGGDKSEKVCIGYKV